MRDNSLASLSEAELGRVSARINALDSPEFPVTTNWDIAGRYNNNIPQGGIRTCRDLWEDPYVDSGGRVTPCCLIPDGMMMHCGNINKQSFSEIWNGPAYTEFREGHLTGKPHKVCDGCQAMNWIYDPATGDFILHGTNERFASYFLGRRK